MIIENEYQYVDISTEVEWFKSIGIQIILISVVCAKKKIKCGTNQHALCFRFFKTTNSVSSQ